MAVRTTSISRRSFLRRVAMGAPLIWTGGPLRGAAAPSNRITLGMIGVGWHGLEYNLRSFLQQDDARVVAVCDVFRSRARKAAEEVNRHYGDAGCKIYNDFRELLDDASVDAVCISTPDHWHVPMTIMAVERGKDVMC